MLVLTPKLPGENNKEYAYRMIKDGIMSLQLKPGQAISEVDLAEALNISRTPIREVLAKLREEYLIEVIPQVGTYVSKINPLLIEEAAFVRVTLEKEILKLACDHFSPESLFTLKQNVAMQEMLAGKKERELEFHKLDKDFHFLLFKENNKENAWAAIAKLSTHYNRMRVLSEMNYGFEKAISEHKKMIEIIENKKVDEAAAIVEQHIIDPIKLWEPLYKSESIFANYIDDEYKKTVI